MVNQLNKMRVIKFKGGKKRRRKRKEKNNERKETRSIGRTRKKGGIVRIVTARSMPL